MPVTITSVYQGKLTVHNTHGPSGSVVETTAPVDNGGTGDLFSPTDLLATALGSCMLIIMGKQALTSGIDFTGASVTVEKHMGDNPRRVSRLVVKFSLPAGLSKDDLTRLERAARTCPVKNSLHSDVEIDITF